ncbi:cardiolipin synthase ClsB [Caenimonas sp. SL110]|uniref:cardiolipin synthase ClsB n=1 Tax=Caenimonas sp. SL110 TaxID=1450524 RepID=UPI000652DBC0|nr:cardiolipin synthase ClsB [Caenimonas sp. SL110]
MAQNLPVPRAGHQVQLLQGAQEYFPALVEAIDSASREVRLETYIFDFTDASVDVAYALERASRRGVSVMVVVDGYGTPSLPPAWRERFLQVGIQWRVFAPLGTFGMLWPGNWSRMHRKLCVVDGEVAFCGGINLLDDWHDPNHGALQAPRFDFAVRVTGPLVAQAQEVMDRQWLRMQAASDMRHARLAGALTSLRAAGIGMRGSHGNGAAPPVPGQSTRAALVLRGALKNRTSIERAYRKAIGAARSEIIIANAYFVPGGKMRRAIISAAQRGVTVKLLLQGRYEYFMQYYAARPIYSALLEAGVEIHEYSPSFLHAKVAVIDGHWATVGSSNLDPLSLLLAREANVMVEDEAFASQLRARLMHAIEHGGRIMDPQEFSNRPMRQRVFERVALIVMRVLLLVQGKKYL